MGTRTKQDRQKQLIELIEQEEIETQGDLVRRLSESGFPVTQATVSRDLRELKLDKVNTGNGKWIYALFQAPAGQPDSKYIRVLKESFLSMDMAMNILVIKTNPGMAMAAAAALDACHFSEIVGCIAGDDTILCAVRTVQDTVFVMKKIKKIINHI